MGASPATHWWRGDSGQQYFFNIFDADEIYDFDGIVYLMTRARSDGLYDVLYVGQSGQGGQRLDQHEKVAAARRLGMTHVHIHFIGDSAQRFAIETDLRRCHRPPLNEQPMPVSGFGALPKFPLPAPPRNPYVDALLAHTAGAPAAPLTKSYVDGLAALLR